MDREEIILALMRETPLTVAEAAGRCRVSTITLGRWIVRGKLIDGRKVHLEAYPSGKSWTTTVEALARFLAAIDAARRGAEPPLTPRQADQYAVAAQRRAAAAIEAFKNRWKEERKENRRRAKDASGPA
jgi:hypothetical protein